jgi:D-xylulose reductase
LAVAVHAIANIGGLRTNQSIAIWGAGPVGLLAMAVARALGASRIIAVDIIPSRLEFAKKYAATDIFVPPSPEAGESKMAYSRRSAAAMKAQLGIEDRGPTAIDIVADASGAEVSIQTAMFLVKTGGNYIQAR